MFINVWFYLNRTAWKPAIGFINRNCIPTVVILLGLFVICSARYIFFFCKISA
ncbi:hypothetical protein HanIR_Chr09g0424181 [Helianthus annuus]|nr:hypothetical protein HanIR_Chr09g0424181 [Helianthus annuus]